jgi:2-C-methyl-D-erythritol 4-phosphate cytidylyltransferase
MAVALIVAAGRGERLGYGWPKALVTLAGRPMVEWSIRALRSVPAVEQIVLALPPGTEFNAGEEVTTVSGGETRSHSVRSALQACGPGDPVVVHDAARPLAPPELFGRALEQLERSGADAAIAARPVSDTIKEVETDNRTVRATLERGRLWAVQTPQVFRRAVLENVLADASDELLAAATDDAWLVERAGGVVTVLEASAENIKVTTRIDLRLAELLLAEQRT